MNSPFIPFSMDFFLKKQKNNHHIKLIYGPSASGKTTYGLLASISMAKQGKKVLFIDTENGFSIERLKQLSKEDYNKIMDNIFLLRIKSFKDQNKKFAELSKIVKEGNFSLVVVDTLGAHYRKVLKENIKKVNLELIEQLKILKYITRDGSPVLITNQVYSKMDLEGSVESVGGKMVKNFSKVLIELQNLPKGKRKARLLKPNQKDILFKIEKEGFIPV